MSEIAKCRGIVSDLEAKLTRCKARSVEISAERDRISFAVHVDGDPKSRAKLDKFNEEGYRNSGEIASLGAAVKVARERLAAAEHAEAQAADRQKAEEARKIVREMAEVPAYIDKHLMAALKGLLAIEQGFRQLRELGFTHPTDVQVRLGVVTCINTWAMQLPRNWHSELRDGLRYLPPHERKLFETHWKAIEPMLLRQAAGEAQKDTEAA
jgi:hypothetical protein